MANSRRRRAREQALQILYLMDASRLPPAEALNLFAANFKSRPDDLIYARHLVEGVSRQREQLDETIARSSQNWRIERMARIDRSILRLGTFELISGGDVPKAVAIDEAVELGKKYGDTETSGFVNGILDRVARFEQAE